jgi:hypothetical protein
MILYYESIGDGGEYSMEYEVDMIDFRNSLAQNRERLLEYCNDIPNAELMSNQELLDRLNDDDFDEDEVHDFYREDAESEFYIGYNSGPLDSPTDYFGDDWF